MSDFERPRHQDFVDATQDFVTSPVVGEELSELRTAGDRAEALHHAAPLFGDQASGSVMATVGQTAPVKLATDVLAPVSMATNVSEMYKGIAEGHWGDAIHGGAGAFSAGIGTAGAVGDAASWLGTALHGTSMGARLAGAGESLATNVGMKSFLGPAGAVIGSGLAGWDIGNEFNAITKESGEYGKNDDGSNRSFSDKSGDDGWAAHEAVAHFLGGENYGAVSNVLGHVAGGAAVLGESLVGTAEAAPTVIGHEAANLGRAAVSGVEAAGAAINHGASRLFDWICD